MTRADAGVPSWCRPVAEGVEIDTWVAPGGSRSALSGLHDGRLRVAVAAPPEGGKANAAVAKLLADAAGVSVGQLSLLRGAKSRAKCWLIATTTPEVVLARLAGRLERG